MQEVTQARWKCLSHCILCMKQEKKKEVNASLEIHQLLCSEGMLALTQQGSDPNCTLYTMTQRAAP